MGIDAKRLGHALLQPLFHGQNSFARCKSGPVGDAENMCVDGNGGFAECRVEDNIGGFSANAGEGLKRFTIMRKSPTLLTMCQDQ